jgi:hypothetical protein
MLIILTSLYHQQQQQQNYERNIILPNKIARTSIQLKQINFFKNY